MHNCHNFKLFDPTLSEKLTLLSYQHRIFHKRLRKMWHVGKYKDGMARVVLEARLGNPCVSSPSLGLIEDEFSISRNVFDVRNIFSLFLLCRF